MQDLNAAFAIVQSFTKESTSSRISKIERLFENSTATTSGLLLEQEHINLELLNAATTIKRAASQIGEIVHALGILLVLPHILQEGEVVKNLSLAAGNTGKAYDLETNIRVAEFKFNRWQGGSETIRQNQFFKDFYLLAEATTEKKKYLYTTGTSYPLKFLRGKRALRSVFSKNLMLWNDFQLRYNDRFFRVFEYYEHKQLEVVIENIDDIIPVKIEELLSEA